MCSHGNRVHGGGRWSRTVGEADGDTSVRNQSEGEPGQHASEQAGETGSEDARRGYFNARNSGCVRIDVSPLSHLCMVDFGAVVGTLRFDDHRGVKPQDVSFVGGSLSAQLTRAKTLGSDRSVGSRSVFHRKEGMVTRRMANVVHRCQFRLGFFTPVTDHQLQRMPAFRVEVRYSIRNAEQCGKLSTKRRERCVNNCLHIILDSAFGSRISAELHEGSWCAQRRTILFGEWSARRSDTCTRVAVRVISNLQRLVIRALIERPSADPLAEEETIPQFESFMCEKGVGPEDRAKCLNSLARTLSRSRLHVLQS